MSSRLRLTDRVRLRLRRDITDPLQHKVLAPLRRLKNASREFAPIFIAGASGSGTSFVAVALSESFDCAGLVYEMDSQIAENSVLSVPTLEEYESIAEYRAVIRPKDSWPIDALRRDVLDVCRAYATAPGRDMILKGPDINLVRAALMRRCFPDARFVLIFRDPAASIEGLRRKWSIFGGEPLEETIRLYRDLHEEFLRAAESFPESVVGVPYEMLVANKDAALARIGERLGLAPSRRRPRTPANPNIEGQGLRNVQGGQIQVVSDANQRARDRLDPADLRQIEAALASVQEAMMAAPFTLQG